MSDHLVRYRVMVAALRLLRRTDGWVPEHDRVLLERLEDTYSDLSPAEQAIVETEAWKAWPSEQMQMP